MTFRIGSRSIGALALAMLLPGCAGTRAIHDAPRPSPLGRDIVAFEAPARAETQRPPFNPLSGDLRLRDAVSLALLHSPSLSAFSWEIRAREAEALQAGARPNPGLDIEAENFAGSGDFGGFRATETTVALSQLIELGGKRQERLRAAGLHRDLAAWDYESARVDILTETTKDFVAVLVAQEQSALAEELVRVADEVHADVARRVAAGAVSAVEESRARVELEIDRVGRDRARRTLETSRRKLAAGWGALDPGFEAAVGDLSADSPVPALAAIMEHIESNPDLARWGTETEFRRARVSIENSMGSVDPEISVGARHMAETGDRALVLGLSIPLPFSDGNREATRAARFRLVAAAEERRAAEIRIGRQIAVVHEQLEGLRLEIRALRERILPEAENAFAATQETYRRGRMSLTDVLDAERTLFELRSRHTEALGSRLGLVADVERLIGVSLSDITERN